MSILQYFNSAQKTVQSFLPMDEIIYKSKKYNGYMNSQEQSLNREVGGYINIYQKLIHIQTNDLFKLNDNIIYNNELYKITNISKNFVYTILTVERNFNKEK